MGLQKQHQIYLNLMEKSDKFGCFRGMFGLLLIFKKLCLK